MYLSTFWDVGILRPYIDAVCHWNQAYTGGDVAQLVEQVWFPGAARDFSPRVSFQCRLCHGVHTPPWAVACIYICAHIKHHVVLVRVWWTMKTLNTIIHPRLGSATVAAGFPGGRQPEFPMGETLWDNIVVKSIYPNVLEGKKRFYKVEEFIGGYKWLSLSFACSVQPFSAS